MNVVIVVVVVIIVVSTPKLLVFFGPNFVVFDIVGKINVSKN
jgi:hypothetical protein